ncbi:MAG: FixH family protein [Flavobacteriaceae bacterium]|jgi:uncharacterized membrane protein|nr:FixH family protein [Flavobacteriaceae bacterium]
MFKKFNWGHGIALALGLFVIYILTLIILFPMEKNSQVISDNYYEDELLYQRVIDAKNNADALPEKPEYKQTSEEIEITFPQSVNPESGKTNFYLYRTNDSNLDIKKDVVLDEKKSFQIPGKVLRPGSYTLKLMWKENDKSYQIDYSLIWK